MKSTKPGRSKLRKTTNAPATRKPPQFESEPQDGKEPLPFLVVAVGASAGGLEAFTELLRTLPADTGMAF
ncbi:MAG TPA: chemotaxis protein CheB, partial [Candidatus Acidoferrum sp.]|nr:chemotaxis protein CheB [Candidatus Acidoferrum sp.]